MSYREEVVRGVRLGALALAVLLAGVVAYRVVHREPARAAEPANVIAPSPSPAVETTVANEAPAAVKPQIRRVPKKKEEPPRIETAVQQPPAECIVPSKAEEKQPEVAEPAPATVVASFEPAPPAPQIRPKSDNPGKRMIKAMGRFLHIGRKKDGQVEAFR